MYQWVEIITCSCSIMAEASDSDSDEYEVMSSNALAELMHQAASGSVGGVPLEQGHHQQLGPSPQQQVEQMPQKKEKKEKVRTESIASNTVEAVQAVEG